MHPLLDQLYREAFGRPAQRATPIAAQGSKRRMLRLTDAAHSAIGVLGPDPHENVAFLEHSRTLRAAGLRVPEVLAALPDASAYLVEDLGDDTLFERLEAARDGTDTCLPDVLRPAYARTLQWLVRFQLDGGQAVDFTKAYPVAAFDATAIRWDLDAFKYQFLKLGNVTFHEGRLERDVNALTAHLLQADTQHFVYRDFQSRNVMLRPGDEPWFIDYQNGRQGALQYDVASLLFDGKAALTPDVRSELLQVYLEALRERDGEAADRFGTHFGGYVLVRILQAMGAYGYLGFYLRKPHFLASVPHAVRNLRWLAEHEALLERLPELRRIIDTLAEDDRFTGPRDDAAVAGLAVHVTSFAYKHGYPADPGGHGGGFVFDCRAIPNPGREAMYAPLCGLDAPVREHLDASAPALAFFEHARALVARQVDTYLARDFNSLSVSFGCTGGQHRSVWCAEQIAAHLRQAGKGLRVTVTHRERERWPATAGLEPG